VNSALLFFIATFVPTFNFLQANEIFNQKNDDKVID